MTQEEIDAIPDEVLIAAYDEVYPSNACRYGPEQKLNWAKGTPTLRAIARLIMENRALKAQLPEQVDPDLLAARKAAAGYWRERGHSLFAALIEAAKHDDHETVQSALRGIKHGRGEG